MFVKLRKSTLNCEKDKNFKTMVMMIILQNELPARKGKRGGDSYNAFEEY